MRVHRKLMPVLGAAVGCMLVTTAASATAAPAATTAPIALTGNIAGNLQYANPGDPVTFVFTETNQQATANDWFIQPFNLTGVTGGPAECVFPQHRGGGGDGYTCEPDLLRPGQTTSLVLTTTVTGAAGATASVRVCAYNGNGPGFGPCKTLSFKIN